MMIKSAIIISVTHFGKIFEMKSSIYERVRLILRGRILILFYWFFNIAYYKFQYRHTFIIFSLLNATRNRIFYYNQ